VTPVPLRRRLFALIAAGIKLPIAGNFSRIVSGKMRLEVRPVEMATVLEGAVDAVRPAADAKGTRSPVPPLSVWPAMPSGCSRLRGTC